MALTQNPQTLPVLLDLVDDGPFDILDPFGRVFWKDMDKATALNAIRGFDTQHRVVPATGLPYGAKVQVAA